MEKTVVIIGGGIAGVSAAETLRAQDDTCTIFLIEREHTPLYSRVLLPHYVKGVVPRERVFLRTEAWYFEKNITYLSGTEAEEINTAHKYVRISDGREIPYDTLIIASGTRPRVLPEDARGVHYLFTLADADGIRTHLATQSAQEEALVYGGGFIACEFINILVHAGKSPTVLVRGGGFWSKMLLPEGQECIREVLRKNNILFHEKVGEISLSTEGDALAGVTDAQGRAYPGTFLGVGIGADGETEYAQEAGIKTSEGILANEYLQTSATSVYVAGDVAQAVDTWTDGRQRMHGNWAHAQQEGKKVAKTCRESEENAPIVSQYATNILGYSIVFLGDCEIAAAQEVRIVPRNEGYCQVFLRKGVLVGVLCLGNIADRMTWLAMIGKPWK